MISAASPYSVLEKCIHCGLCLPVCPTYALTGKETSSPRGRIRLMKGVEEEGMPVSPKFASEIYFCLDCRACETVCPAGVQYGSLVEQAREHIANENRDPLALRLIKRLFLNSLMNSKGRTKLAFRLLSYYHRSGLREAIERSSILTIFSDRLHRMHALLPKIDAPAFDGNSPELFPPSAGVKKRGRVAFLKGCVMNYALPQVHKDAIEVLQAYGYEVFVPRLQECCGSLHAHNGEIEAARRLARANIEAFGAFEFDAFVIDSAGCGAFMKEYGRVLVADAEFSERAAAFSAKVKDISEFLVTVPSPTLRPLKKRVTYHEACHLVHAQKISEEPRQLIRSIPGIEFVELPEATWCCGSAGIYNISRHSDSMQMLDRKMNHIATTGAEIVVTANPGCHIQLFYGAQMSEIGIEILHPVSLIRKALSA